MLGGPEFGAQKSITTPITEAPKEPRGLKAEEIEQLVIQRRAAYAKPGEQWITNTTFQEVSEEEQRKTLTARYSGYELRFDFIHLIDEYGREFSGDDFSHHVSGVFGGESAAVYAKPKSIEQF